MNSELEKRVQKTLWRMRNGGKKRPITEDDVREFVRGSSASESDEAVALIPELYDEVARLEAEVGNLYERKGFLEAEIEWIQEHIHGGKINTKATRDFITDRNTPQAKALLRICELLDAEAEVVRLTAENLALRFGGDLRGPGL